MSAAEYLFDRAYSRVLHVNLSTGQSKVLDFGLRQEHLGGSGLAAALYDSLSLCSLPFDAPEQPIIFAIGPLTGLYPLMSKVVCGFRSPYTGEWAESHAGGRLGLALRFAGYDALMLTGRAPVLSCLTVAANKTDIQDISFLRGADVLTTGKYMRRFSSTSAGHRSSMRIGPAGERGVAYACINVDSFRHFGRLGSGAVLGNKNIKGIVVLGDGGIALPQGKAYPALSKELHTALTRTPLMRKYHDLGTAENLAPLNDIKALPWRNLQATTNPRIGDMTGEYLGDNLLLRQAACAGCPVGCIHIAMLREQFGNEHEFLYRQVPYDFEPMFALGTMLGLTSPEQTLALMDETEKNGLDCMSTGVALAWATEAYETGLINEQETGVPFSFGEWQPYMMAIGHIAQGSNHFYRMLGQGTLKAANKYGGKDFACVLGQEMAGYATGEVFFTSQLMGFRHSHLDSGGYSYDQTSKDKNPDQAIAFLLADEKDRVLLTCMVSCLFARKAYSTERLAECLEAVGLTGIAANLEQGAVAAQALRWRLKLATGFNPLTVPLPKRYTQIATWKGPVDTGYLDSLRAKYAAAIAGLSANKC